jgi:site-specific recombinase XerD
MPNTYNLYNLEPQFKTFLVAENISNLTLINYLSDFRHFAAWFEAKINLKTEIDFIDLINYDTVNQYKSYLFESSIPLKTINRRLSTLRKFCSFAIQQGWMKNNAAKQVQNAKISHNNESDYSLDLLGQYQKYLLNEKGLDSNKAEQSLEIIKEFFLL